MVIQSQGAVSQEAEMIWSIPLCWHHAPLPLLLIKRFHQKSSSKVPANSWKCYVIHNQKNCFSPNISSPTFMIE